MSINIEALEKNVNLHALQPDFLNFELHYIIAKDENTFRFAAWNEEPDTNEKKLYCFLTEQELAIPDRNIALRQSYVVKDHSLYPAASEYKDFVEAVSTLEADGAAKRVRRFYDEDIDTIKEGLEQKYGVAEKHVVTSRQGQHLLFLLDSVEISISATMVYFRYKTPFNENHYKHVKEEEERN